MPKTRRRSRQRNPSHQVGLLPPPELAQHHRVEVGDRIVFGEDGRATSKSYGARVLTQRMVDRYRLASQITDRQHKAAETLWQAFYAAGLEPRAVANLNRANGPGECTYGMAATERQAHARKLWRAAVAAVGIYHSRVVLGVVCEDRAASDCTGLAGKRAAVIGLDRLRVGLDMLADHYGLDRGTA